jgi:peptidoglycan/LPS O-acetylase OafA/YrhL
MEQLSALAPVVLEPPPLSVTPVLSDWRNWLASFRRLTSSTRYIPEIDGLRFIAIASVFIFHTAGDILRHSPANYRDSLAADPFFALTQRLNIGVQLFFAISGFVLALPFAAQYLTAAPAVNLKRYLYRRVTRLEPPYIVALCIFFLLKLAGARGSVSMLATHFLASLGYVHNLIYGEPSSVNFVAWSLEIEIQFYLLAPLLAAILFAPRNAAIRRGLTILTIVASACIPLLLPPDSRVSLSLLGQAGYFLAGLLLADLYVSNGQRTWGTWWGDAVALGAAAGVLSLLWQPVLLAFCGPLLVCAAYYGVLRGEYVRRVLSVTILTIIGGGCYSIYLIHNYIIAVAGYATERLAANAAFEVRLAIQCLLLGGLVLLLSAVYFKLIEQSCMNAAWPQKLKAHFGR